MSRSHNCQGPSYTPGSSDLRILSKFEIVRQMGEKLMIRNPLIFFTDSFRLGGSPARIRHEGSKS